ncbi:MAG: carboxymuconolactone decarboxylase family protein [Burkholderiales bacterium]
MRLPPLDKTKFTADQQRLWDRIAQGPRGGVRGPYHALLHSPNLCDGFEAVGRFLRYECAVPPRLRELAILVVARRWRAQYEWFAHAPIAAKEGVSAQVIDAIRLHKEPVFDKNDERVIFNFVHELMHSGFVGDAHYAAAQQLLGPTGMVDLVGFVGQYNSVALILNAFEIGLPEGERDPFAL